MKKCKIVNGQLRCEADNLVNFGTTEFGPIGLVSNQTTDQLTDQTAVSPISNGAVSPISNDSLLHDAYDEHIKPNLPFDDKKVHPVFHHFKTRPTTNSVHPHTREKAILNKAALKYYKTGSKAQVERYLHDMNVGHKYTIDFEMSNSDGLVVLNNKTQKVTLALRGSDKPWKTPMDWAENTQNFLLEKNNPMNTNYGKRLDSWFENVNSAYEIEHITGYSKGGFGAISLGDAKGIQTTTFAPAVSLSNLKTTSNVKHNINNTTEDFASVLAEPMKLSNPNVTVNTYNPLSKFNPLNPEATHKIEQYIDTDSTRSSHVNVLSEKYLSAKVKLHELNLHARVREAIKKNVPFTEFVRSEHPKLVNNIDDTLNFKYRNNSLQKAWHHNGGRFSLTESQQLTVLPEAKVTKFNTSQSEIDDFHNKTPEQQAKHRIELESKVSKHELEIKTAIKNVDNTVHSRILPGPRSALIAGGSMLFGSGIEKAIGSLDEFTNSNIPSTLAPYVAAGGGAGAASVVTGGLATGLLGPEIGAGVASMKLGQAAGNAVKNQLKNKVSEQVAEHAQVMTEGAVGGGSFLGFVSTFARIVAFGTEMAGLAASTVVAPEVTIPTIIASAAGGAAINEGVNAVSKITTQQKDLTPKKQDILMQAMSNPMF